ncbi:MAG: glutamine-hydrolyzing carbamoyl-phosphate synthase small subunit [Bacteroidetes bacterium]|nr:glutamine-hydrolyzing carbamoyl-phosphate synthase small subunit [Bacteroidota bacterium]
MNNTFLILSDGSVYPGTSFGSPAVKISQLAVQNAGTHAAGEVVFNTSMTGYHEIMTDPSYTGQIVLMTYPHIGNYGTDDSWNESGPEPISRSMIKAKGLIVRDYYDGPVPPGRKSLHQFMVENKIPGISGIDTRKLTLSLRDEGSRNGILIQFSTEALSEAEVKTVTDWLRQQPEMAGQNLVGAVGTREIQEIPASSKTADDNSTLNNVLHFALLDCGIKANIVRELEKRNIKITILPSDTDLEKIISISPDALLISNGPGDPAVLHKQISLLQNCIGKLPLFGICLGHQLISLALGAKTYKMKFGHHGGNHPVRDEFTGKVCVTSQNHGFAVEAKTLPHDVDIWFTNTNDNSIEGISHTTLPIMSVQFHPEAAPGPMDANWIFDSYISRTRSHKNI